MVEQAPTHNPSRAVDPKPPPPRSFWPKPPPVAGQFRLSPVSWIILLILMVWNVWSFVPRESSQSALPYSEFKKQVADGNVSRVRIVGDQITGTFVQGVVGPAPSTFSTFRTAFPSVVGDVSLMPLLEAHHVVADVATPSQPWFALLLTSGLPVVLMLLLIVWMGRQAARSQAGMFGFGRNKSRRYAEDRPKVTFADVAGADEAKADLSEVVDVLRAPRKYLELGARLPRGVLLVGPPGTGKTLLARAVAGEAGVPFFSISGSEFVEMFVGVGASRVRDLFVQAKAVEPSIVFVDELDAVGRRRGAGVGATNDEREQTLNQLLVEMDGFAEHQQVVLLAATNRPDVLDPALLRPGRFDRQIAVPLPDWRGREGILRIHTRHLNVAADVDLERLARTTTGLSGADLANLCNEAALGAARHDRTEVTMEDFEQAWDK